MIAPPISQANRAVGRLPPEAFRTSSALKNTPEPITIPITIAIAVQIPYFFSRFCISHLTHMYALRDINALPVSAAVVAKCFYPTYR